MKKDDLEKEEKLKLEAREISIKEGSAYAVSEGFGIRSVMPYLLEVGKGVSNINYYVGLLSSFPTLLSNFSQLLSARLIEKYKRKKIVFWSVFFQALMWLAMLIPGVMYFYLGSDSAYASMLVVVIYTLLAIAGSISGPAWNSWMSGISPPLEERGKFFGKRSKIIGAISLIFGLLSGFVLDYFKKTNVFVAFIILFGVSFLFRLYSALLFRKQYEPKLELNNDYYFSFYSYVKKMFSNNFGKFNLFIAFFSAAINIASPFFAVYMLKELGLDYVFFTAVVLSSALSAILSMSFWGNAVDKYGTVKVLKFTGLWISFIPFLWLFSFYLQYNFVYLIIFLFIIELLGGFVWGGFNLSATNFIFNAVTPQRMGLCTSYYNMVNAVFVFFAALFGGYLAGINYGIIWPSVMMVFVVSGVLRIITYVLFFYKIKEVREIDSSLDLDKDLREVFLGKFKFIEDTFLSIANYRLFKTHKETQ